MMTVKQVSSLTGISVRTLQFYDEIGLLKPSELTDKGYRQYFRVLAQFKETHTDEILREMGSTARRFHRPKRAA